MLTPQEVSTHAFTKAVMGGYNMAMVDEFLDELTDDYTALYKENAALKAKLKVLVEKVEEYRATEDSMRATLLTAQRMADSIVREAEGKRDEILAQAESGAQEKVAHYQQELAASEERLKQGRLELAKFIAAAREVCSQELQLLDRLPDLPVATEQPAPAEAPVEEIEEKVMAAFAAQPAEEAPAIPPADDYPEGDPFAQTEDPLEATRRIDLDDLKFGRNYSGGGN
ncbi:DivIVA domain-containing protein [uncultured Dysosmobacter sp.]|uniref:DivIVA domain-containing protein n=1 Tax=uncultured Dysosmobacter sp. TaxID=2591384 RepID=UPI00260F9970|nr:DivIVA domain-containing protein [uncultured Dysosmobacter sp.]